MSIKLIKKKAAKQPRRKNVKTEISGMIKTSELKDGMIIEVIAPYIRTALNSAYAKDQAQPGDIIYIKMPPVYGLGIKGTLLSGESRKNLFISQKEMSWDDTHGVYIPGKEPIHRLLKGAELEKWIELKYQDLRKNITGHIQRGREDGFSTGSDPEMFVVDKQGIVIPAFDFLSAESTINKSVYSGSGYKVPYFDGFQAEFNISPNACHANVGDSLRGGLYNLFVAAKNHNEDATLTYKSVIEVPEEIMERCTAKQVGLGCNPSLNAYNTEGLYVEDPRSLPIRFAGCHIHFALPTEKRAIAEIIRRVKTIDRIAGPIMTCLLQGIEDPRRRAFYGRAGEYRTPAHGMEYRVPSSTALCHPIVAHLVFDMVRFAKQFAETGHEKLWQMPGGDEQAQDILNNYNIPEAKRILRLNESLLDQMLTICYSVANGTVSGVAPLSKEKFNKLKAMIMEGVGEHLNFKTVARNWKLHDNQVWRSHCGSPDSCVVNMKLRGSEYEETD